MFSWKNKKNVNKLYNVCHSSRYPECFFFLLKTFEYLVESNCFDSFNGYPQLMFSWKNKKNVNKLYNVCHSSRKFYTHQQVIKWTLTLKAPRKTASEMSSVYVVCWIFLQTFWNYSCIQANSVDPDQTAPKGAVWSGSTLFAEMTYKITSRWESRRQLLWLAL